MERVLIVVDDRESGRELLEEAGTLAASAGAEIIAVTVVTEDEYSNDIETLEQIGNVENMNYEETPGEFARNIASTLGSEVLGEDVEYETIGAVVDDGEQADRILSIANERDCDYVYLNGKRRSPTGKALFGDRAQKVLLNFDGYVVVKMED